MERVAHEVRTKRIPGLCLRQTGDAELAHLGKLKGLKALFLLGGNRVTDVGLERLKDLEHLSCLHLSDTHVTDAGLEHLKNLKSLRELNLSRTQVTDAGLVHLRGLKDLKTLSLVGCEQLTEAGVQELQRSLAHTTLYGP